MITRGLDLLQRRTDRMIFLPHERIGIKINTIGGRNISTRPETSMALADRLHRSVSPREMIIWDRSNRELKDAGYRLNTGSGLKIFGTDSTGAGYEHNLFARGQVGSLFSTIQTTAVQSSISLAILKDHGLAGITAGMKNYFGAVHNPNKYHDNNCDPFIPEVFSCSPVQNKHRLTVIDALVVQYHRGPSYHARWAEPYGALLFGVDPVATDAVGHSLIEKLRAKRGLPTLAEENRPPLYLKTASGMGLGQSELSEISLLEDEV